MSRVISSGPLERPDWFKTSFTAEVQGKRFAKYLAEFSRSYYNQKEGLPGPQRIFEMVQPGANGLAIVCSEFESDFFRIFIDHIKELVRAEGYYLCGSEAKLTDEDGVEILSERHYLKPPLSVQQDGLTEQMFGNVTLEYIMKQGRADHMKIACTYRLEPYFAEPRSLHELIDLITEIGH